MLGTFGCDECAHSAVGIQIFLLQFTVFSQIESETGCQPSCCADTTTNLTWATSNARTSQKGYGMLGPPLSQLAHGRWHELNYIVHGAVVEENP
eukprot:6173793-Pleurochrysis_carterae.AAC.1